MRAWAGAFAVLVCACGAKTDLQVRAHRPSIDASVPRDAVVPSDHARPPIDAPVGVDAPLCGAIPLVFGEIPPTVALVLDRSGSMRLTFREPTPHYPEPASRWEVLLELLVGPGFVQRYERRVRFAAATYSSGRDVCPDMTWVPPALDNAEAIARSLGDTGPGGGTPTAEAIGDVAARLIALGPMEGGTPVLVLATDGEPTGCGGGIDPESDVVRAAREAHERGMDTYVISVGEEIAEEHLQQVADAGRGIVGEPHAEFWVATGASGLGTAFREIIASAATCRAELPGDPDPARLCEATITIDGAPIPCGGADGWGTQGRILELGGEACARVRAGGIVAGSFPCGVLR